MTHQPLLYTLETEPPRITILSPKEGQVLSHIDLGWGTPDGLWIDKAEGRLYWTNMGKDYAAADGTINTARLDGRDHKTLIGHGLVVTPKQLTSAPHCEHLYWCDREGMRIMRCRRDGSNLEVLLQRGTFPTDMTDCTLHCVGIALDTHHNYLYWTQKGPPKGGTGSIFRMALERPEGMDPAHRTDIDCLLSHLPEPIDLHLSSDGRILWWTDRGGPPNGSSLNVAHVDKQGLHDHRIIARDLGDAIGLAIDEAKGCAFVSNLEGALYEINLTTAEARLLTQQGPMTGLHLLTP